MSQRAYSATLFIPVYSCIHLVTSGGRGLLLQVGGVYLFFITNKCMYSFVDLVGCFCSFASIIVHCFIINSFIYSFGWLILLFVCSYIYLFFF